MKTGELACRILEGLLTSFYGYPKVDSVFTRRNSQALEILVIASSDMPSDLNPVIVHWLCLDSVLETINGALTQPASTPPGSSLEIKVRGGQETMRTVFHLLNESVVGGIEVHANSRNELPWCLVARNEVEGDGIRTVVFVPGSQS